MKTDKYIITIGRQYGSGGHVIGKILAEKLGFAFFDKELINIASKESGLGKEFFEKADEKKTFGIFGGLLGLRSSFIADDSFYNYLSNETLFQIQSDVIREQAEKQSCVFVGRCADYILREYPNCVNIFITADLPERKKQVLDRMPEIPEDKIEDILEKTDKKRAEYYNYYSGKMWGVAESYHICMNSSLCGIDETAKGICNFVKDIFKMT